MKPGNSAQHPLLSSGEVWAVASPASGHYLRKPWNLRPHGPQPGWRHSVALLDLSSSNLYVLRLLLVCTPSSCSPVSSPQQLKCQEQFLQESWWHSALQLHTEQVDCQLGQRSPSNPLAAVPECARLLSCKFQSFSLLHYILSFSPILSNFYFLHFKKILGVCFLTPLHSLFLGISLTVCSGKQEHDSKGIWEEIWGSMDKISLHSQNQLKCSKCTF